MEPARHRRRSCLVGPLRYPGAKRRLAPYVGSIVRSLARRPQLFVEPFAGGASVALQMLEDDLVDEIALADRDPLVAAFWQTVFDDTNWLLDQIMTIEVTLANWDSFKNGRHRTRRQRALACLFLNRTSYSGIIAPRAGPIGGREGNSAYPIDCRFPRATLARRIRRIAAHRERVRYVAQADWRTTLVEGLGDNAERSFVYLDPPFFNKAERLYTYHFMESDHVRLRDHLVRLNSPWLLSYDSCDHVDRLYASRCASLAKVELLYTASDRQPVRSAVEAVVSNLPLPKETIRLWSSSTSPKKRED